LRAGATVSNLPAGSVYWTVVEESTRGDVRLTNGSVLGFDAEGRVTEGPYTGERISHLGIATNSAVGRTTGWTFVDQHRAGTVFLALGENRYMGGHNSSAINVDLLPAEPTLLADGSVVVDRGRLRPA
jgi:leucyl aminopeptidase (aminopeptidase T)